MKLHLRSLASSCLVLMLALVSTQRAEAQLTSLIESGDDWKILDNGSTPAANWKTNAFVDTSWRTAAGSFGYKVDTAVSTNGAASLINFNAGNVIGNNKYITTYFRKKFTLTAAQASGANAITALIIGMRWDDGVVVYINGTEIRRENMPAGTPSNGTLASAAINVNAMTYTNFLLSSGTLLTGDNTVAVELHQAAVTSSDVFMDLSLTGSKSLPYFGDGTIGIYQDFETNIQNMAGFYAPTWDDYAGYMREVDNGKTLLQYAATSSKHNTGLPGGTFGIFNSIFPGTSKQLNFTRNSNFLLYSERVDTQNYSNIQASVELRSQIPEGVAWATGVDHIKGTISYSTDGQFYTNVPWFDFQTGAQSTVQTTLVEETAPFYWLVPTINQNPTNTTSNPTDWMNVVPTGWSAYNVKPGNWNNGNLPATSIKGGMGYDDNTTIDYNPHIDQGSKAAMRTQLYSKETRINGRIPFSVPNININTITKVELILRYDDAIAAWINGVEIVDTGFLKPANDATIPAARDDNTSRTPRSTDITALFKANVVANSSNNILAIRGFNAGTTSSDMLANWKLVIHTPGPPGPNTTGSLQTPGNMITVNSGTIIPNGASSVRLKIQGTLSGSDFKQFYVDNVRISGTPTAAVDLGSTIALQAPFPTFPAASQALTADADSDGIQNLLEYAFGGHAGISKQTVTLPDNSVQSITPTVTALPDGRLRVQFRALEGAITEGGGALAIRDLIYEPELTSSPETESWSSVGVFVLDPAFPPVTNEDGTQTITIKTDAALIGNDPKYFLRVRVTNVKDPWLSPNFNPLLGGNPFPESF